jgi:hypothetical protein
VQERLLGDWTFADGKEKLKLRSFDDSVALLTKNAHNLELFGEEIEFRKEK